MRSARSIRQLARRSVRKMSTLRPFVKHQEALQPRNDSLLRVVTYNVLANKYALGGNAYCPPEFLRWQYRMPRIIAELQHYAADLLCLQEVERPFYDQDLQPLLAKEGYGGIYQGRVLPEVATGPEEGIALFYRQQVFELLASTSFCFREHAFGSPRLVHQLQSRHEGAVLLLLRHRASQQPLLACSTHLYWNPNFPDVKAAQAAVLCSQISALLQQQVQQGLLASTDVPVIVGGDFNSLAAKWQSDSWDEVPPGGHVVSGVYQLMATGALASDHPDHPFRRQPGGSMSEALARERLHGLVLDTAGLQLQSMHMMAHGSEPPLTTKTASFAGCLDYIWVTPKHLQVASTLAMPFPPGALEPQQVQMLPIPNKVWPSDHLAMGCDLRLVTTAAAAREGAGT